MKLANIFCDNMVFQAEKPIRFFGEGSGEVEITLKNNTYKPNLENTLKYNELYNEYKKLSEYFAKENNVMEKIRE